MRPSEPEPMSRLTAGLSDVHRAVLERVGAYFLASGCEGWIEYWFWDVVEGRRPWIFWLDPDEGIRADMLVLRDEAGVWFTWSFTRRVWEPVRLAVWREHAAKHGFAEAQNRCADFQKKVGPRQNRTWGKEVLLVPNTVVVEEEPEAS